MQHLDEGTIHSWLDNALSPDEAARVEAHVAECPECAAAVAEARGFVAASSRILTALDDAPRGVLPAAGPVRRGNRAMLRAAAAVLVVAAGSLVVLRNGERETQRVTNASDAALSAVKTVAPPAPMNVDSTRAASEAAVGIPTEANSSRRTAISSQQRNTVSIEKRAAKTATADAVTATDQAFTPSRVADAAVVAAAPEAAPLRVVETPRRPGETVTVYEVAPGDTVTLTELLVTRVNLPTAVPLGRQGAGRASGMSTKTRADAAAASGSGYSGYVTAPAPAVSAPASAPQVGFANPVRTIKWTDGTTGNTMMLSGRKSEAQLQEIRRWIEKERAAAAAKKKP